MHVWSSASASYSQPRKETDDEWWSPPGGRNGVPVVSQDEERPEHGPLRRPVERPHRPAIHARRRRAQRRHHRHVARHVPQRPPGALAPAVLRHRRAHVADAERRRFPGVEGGVHPPAAPHDVVLRRLRRRLLKDHLIWPAHRRHLCRRHVLLLLLLRWRRRLGLRLRLRLHYIIGGAAAAGVGQDGSERQLELVV